LNADPRSTARTVAIGNAAQTLHPVAGQGLNLGLRDVTVLARLLAQGATRRCWRSSPRNASATAALPYASPTPWPASSPTTRLRRPCSASLAAIDIISPARSLLAELMMYGRR
jgi:2-octaprenyl-6-methoxyphenol hydroxylase